MGITRAQAFPSNYLGKEDVASPIFATIHDVIQEEISGDNGKETKVVIKWREPGIKAMILNNTNWMVLEDAYGGDSDLWLNKRVEVFVDPSVMYGGKRVGGVRLRVPNGHAAATPVAPAPMSLDDAIRECATVGIGREELIAELKRSGFEKWNKVQCPPLVKQFVAAKSDGRYTANEPLGDEDIPF